MQSTARRRFLILAVAAFAWLAGTGQHAAMGIRHALGDNLSAICSAGGTKWMHTGGPTAPVKPPAGGDCQVCAHFSAPAASQSGQLIIAVQFAAASIADGSTSIHPRHTERRSARGPPPVA